MENWLSRIYLQPHMTVENGLSPVWLEVKPAEELKDHKHSVPLIFFLLKYLCMDLCINFHLYVIYLVSIKTVLKNRHAVVNT